MTTSALFSPQIGEGVVDEKGMLLHPATVMPHSCPIGAHEAMNPAPKLLLSFPAPRLLSQMRLETSWVHDETAEALSGAWSTEEQDQMATGMQQSMQQLLLTGAFSHFLQEQFHLEVAADTETMRAIPSEVTAASRALQNVSAVVARGTQRLLSTRGSQAAVLEVTAATRARTATFPSVLSSTTTTSRSSSHRVPLTHVPAAERWVRNEEGPVMSVRPRPSGEMNTDAAQPSDNVLDFSSESGINAPPPRRSSTVNSSAATRVAAAGAIITAYYEPRTGAAMSGLGDAQVSSDQAHTSFATWVAEQWETAASGKIESARVQSFLAVLPIQSRPFDGIEPALLSRFLVSLVPVEAHAIPASETFAFGLLCCQCLAHPHLPPGAVPEGLASSLVDLFARLVRAVTTELHADETTNGRSSTASLSTKVPSATAFSLLEQLRGYVGAFAVMLCNPTVRLLTDVDVARVEEVCHRCLFRVTRDCTKEAQTRYVSYIVDGAVHLYRCVWNRLEGQRQRTAEAFFQQLPLSDALTQRTYALTREGRTVLPLTVAVLAAVQSAPVLSSDGDRLDTQLLQRQCGQWTHLLLEHLVLAPAGGRDKAADAVATTLTLRMAEDLVDLLGMPEWPGADPLLRCLVLGLAQRGLGTESTATSSTTAGPQTDEALRPLTVDVLGHVAVRLFNPQRFPVPAAVLAELERTCADAAHPSGTACTAALQHVLGAPPPLPGGELEVWGRFACGFAEEVPSGAVRWMAVIYMATSRLLTHSSTAVDYAATWQHIRSAQLLVWAALQEGCHGAWPSLADVEGLARWRPPPGSGSSGPEYKVNWAEVCTWTQALGALSSTSVLSLRMRHTIVSQLVSVFYLKDSAGAPVAVSDVVQKKTLAHLARLTAAHPALHRYLWPIARQCVRDDGARVRESIVPLLLTLLSGAVAEEDADMGPLSSEGGSSSIGLSTRSVGTAADGVAAEVISSLLYLLSDRSVAVVSRTIAALDALLTDDAHSRLFATPHGMSLLAFIQHKLMARLAEPTTEVKHRQEIARHFLHRWILVLAESDAAMTGAQSQLATELLALTVMDAAEYPHDVIVEQHPLVQLLREMQALAAAESAAAATPSSAQRRRTRVAAVDSARLLHVMRCTAQSLCTRYQFFHSGNDAISCLATLRVLGLACSAWVVPLAGLLVQGLAYPPPATSPLASAPEALGGSLLQSCQILHSILQGPKLPLISLDHFARCLTTLLSKYVGPYQQRVIVASCGALCGLITCGAKNRFSAQVNVPYLQLCYSLMNNYYGRIRALLPTLATNPQSIAYTQRFLFLLSEFLRLYPGWRHHPPHPALLEDAVGGQTPSIGLAHGQGIAANVFALAEAVQRCGRQGSEQGSLSGPVDVSDRLAVITLRVVASVCMLEPSTYLYRAEGQIRAALRAADHHLQVQGLSLLSDFVAEEDALVDAAARQSSRLDTTALILGSGAGDSTSESGEEEEKGRRAGRTAKRRRGAKEAAAAPANAGAGVNVGQKRSRQGTAATAVATEDFNSGMATWVFQTFHDDIVQLGCGSPQVAVRQLCLRLLRQAAQGGLLPPEHDAHVLVAFAADPHPPLRERALTALVAHCEAHVDRMASAIPRGVLLAFDLHYHCHVHLLRSALVVGESVHAGLYRLLVHKRLRDGMTTALLRYFYVEGKLSEWWADQEGKGAVATSDRTATADVFHTLHPVVLLAHLTLVLAALPYAQEGDVVHVIQQARVGIDLMGQAALAALSGEGASMSMCWIAVGVLLLHRLRRALMAVYRIRPATLRRYEQGPGPRRGRASTQSTAAIVVASPLEGGIGIGCAVMEKLYTVVESTMATLAPALWTGDGDTWRHVAAELEQALLDDGAEHIGEGGGRFVVTADSSASRGAKRTVHTARAARVKRGRRRRVSETSTSESSSEEEEVICSTEEEEASSSDGSQSDDAVQLSSSSASQDGTPEDEKMAQR